MAGKGELTDQVAQSAGMSKAQAAKAVNAVLDAIVTSLQSGEDVSLPGFGSWHVADTKARTGRNPRTGASINIPASKRVAFSAGSKLSQAVRGA